MNKSEFIKFFMEKYGKDFNLKSELFRSILLDFEEKLEDDPKKKQKVT